MLPGHLQTLLADILLLGGERKDVEPLVLGYLAGYDSSVDWKNAPDFERLAELEPDEEGTEWLEEKLLRLKHRLERRRRVRGFLLAPLRPIFTPRVVAFIRRHADAERSRAAAKKRDRRRG